MYIDLTTIIDNSTKVCFDLSRSIDLHKISTAHTKEEAIAGRTSGLIDLGETVTWRAKHLGFYQTLTTEITQLSSPSHFRDEQVKGPFKIMQHDHFFETENSKTVMRDVFIFSSPLGFLGKLVDRLFLKTYLTKLLVKRNQTIKEFAESEKWKDLTR